MRDRDFDAVIIGAGLGGLQCAITLAREGMKVCVLEQNSRLGGSLHVFSRDKTVFDTGVHYIGGLCPGQNLHQYFSYYGIMDKLKLKRMDIDAFDRVELQGDPHQYPYAQGWDNFVNRLSEHFPGERAAIARYAELVVETCDRFPLYRLRDSNTQEWMDDRLTWNAEQVIASLTSNVTLQQVFAGSNALYAGDHASPFYVHALVVNTYVESSWRCVDGGIADRQASGRERARRRRGDPCAGQGHRARLRSGWRERRAHRRWRSIFMQVVHREHTPGGAHGHDRSRACASRFSIADQITGEHRRVARPAPGVVFE